MSPHEVYLHMSQLYQGIRQIGRTAHDRADALGKLLITARTAAQVADRKALKAIEDCVGPLSLGLS